MFRKSLKACGLACVFVVWFGVGNGWAQPGVDSLVLKAPTGVFVVPEMNVNRQRFVNWIFWTDLDDSLSTLVHQPDTTGWNAPTSSLPQDTLSVPTTSGAYFGTVDRTISFRAINSGTVGVTPNIVIRYQIIGEEAFNSTLNVGAGYTPDTPIPVTFLNTTVIPPDTLDLGFKLQFSPGLVDSNGLFLVGLEDFEGFHIWRGILPSGSDLTIVGEMSKEEEFAGSQFDSLYFDGIIPALRATGRYSLPFPVPGVPAEIDIRNVHPNGKLGPNEFVWFDRNAFNGFTYRYTVTTFDRGYAVRSTSQGLFKFDHCQPEQGIPYPCASELIVTSSNVSPQNDLQMVYAVPNPFRSGSTQFSTPNYHNFPDNKMRFVNVPAQCTLKIFTPAGDLVWETEHVAAVTGGNIEWDTRNTSGREVSSGIYIFRVEAANGDGVYGRIVIIR